MTMLDRRRRHIKLRLKDTSLRRDPGVRRWIRDCERRMERRMEAELDDRMMQWFLYGEAAVVTKG